MDRYRLRLFGTPRLAGSFRSRNKRRGKLLSPPFRRCRAAPDNSNEPFTPALVDGVLLIGSSVALVMLGKQVQALAGGAARRNISDAHVSRLHG